MIQRQQLWANCSTGQWRQLWAIALRCNGSDYGHITFRPPAERGSCSNQSTITRARRAITNSLISLYQKIAREQREPPGAEAPRAPSDGWRRAPRPRRVQNSAPRRRPRAAPRRRAVPRGDARLLRPAAQQPQRRLLYGINGLSRRRRARTHATGGRQRPRLESCTPCRATSRT